MRRFWLLFAQTVTIVVGAVLCVRARCARNGSLPVHAQQTGQLRLNRPPVMLETGPVQQPLPAPGSYRERGGARHARRRQHPHPAR